MLSHFFPPLLDTNVSVLRGESASQWLAFRGYGHARMAGEDGRCPPGSSLPGGGGGRGGGGASGREWEGRERGAGDEGGGEGEERPDGPVWGLRRAWGVGGGKLLREAHGARLGHVPGVERREAGGREGREGHPRGFEGGFFTAGRHAGGEGRAGGAAGDVAGGAGRGEEAGAGGEPRGGSGTDGIVGGVHPGLRQGSVEEGT